MITKQKGTYDIYGEEAKKRLYVNDIIKGICEKYNYTYIETPVFEATELFHRGVGETSDVVKKETYDFVDRGDRNITLRPEGTAGVVRWFIENKLYGNMTEPVKVYYNEKMYRYERPQSGRNREFTQFGVELIGSDDVMADVDVISLAYQTYTLLGLDTKIKINTLGDNESRLKYKDALIKYLEPHMDELCEDCKERISKNPLRVLDCKIDGEKDIIKGAPITLDYLNEDSLNRYNKLKDYLDLLEIPYEEDPRLVRGLDYYNHTVFEIYTDIEGVNFALGGGGRYNGLIKELDGPEMPAVGFAMGYDRTMIAIDAAGVNIPYKKDIDVYVMYVSDSEKETASYIVQNLRLNGFTTETDYLNKGLKGEFKSADRFNAKFLIILNDKDLESNEVNVKDNVTKEEEKVNINDLIDYLDMHD